MHYRFILLPCKKFKAFVRFCCLRSIAIVYRKTMSKSTGGRPVVRMFWNYVYSATNSCNHYSIPRKCTSIFFMVIVVAGPRRGALNQSTASLDTPNRLMNEIFWEVIDYQCKRILDQWNNGSQFFPIHRSVRILPVLMETWRLIWKRFTVSVRVLNIYFMIVLWLVLL